MWTPPPPPEAAAAAGDEPQLRADSAAASGKVISLLSNKSYIKVIEKEERQKNREHSRH